MFLNLPCKLVLAVMIISWQFQMDYCEKVTFESTAITALRNLQLRGEITDYNFFSKAKSDNVISIHHVTGSIQPMDELEEAVAIQIRDQKVPIMYENAIEHLPLLHSLHIESSQVNILKPNTFNNLPALTVIKLIDNNIHTIPTNVFNSLTIEKLVLSQNHISNIEPQAFDDMPKLRAINLDTNYLVTWNTDWFENCPRVEYLSIKFNHLSSLPSWAFKNIQETLERLYLSYNRITNIDPNAFFGLRNLTDLSLSNNDLKYLNDGVFSFSNNLTLIDLSDTSISCLTSELLQSLQSRVLIWINNVPLNQTCLETLNYWSQQIKSKVTFYKSLKEPTTVKPTTKSRIKNNDHY